MRREILSLGLALCLAAPLVTGCEPRRAGAVAATSATEGGYATAWPDALAAARQRVADVEVAARAANQELAKFPGELRAPDPTLVLVLYAKADEAGRSAGYGKVFEESELVSTFFSEEKTELEQRVAGAAQYAAKQKGCALDAHGAVSGALGKAVAERLERRLRASNEAQRHLEAHGAGLSREDAATLALHIDDLSLASYLAHQALPRARARLEALLAEADTVKDTLEREQIEAQAVETDPKAKPAARDRARARREAARAAAGRVQEERDAAARLLGELDQRTLALRDEYRKAYEALRAAVQSRGTS